jgi:hypothetical protein
MRSNSVIQNRFHIRIEHLWGLVVLLGIFIFVNTHPIRPQDFWWHIKIGQEIVTTGKIPTVDVFSYTEMGQSYPSYQMFWLMEIFLYEIYNLGGPALVIFTFSLIITATYSLIYLICLGISNSWRQAAVGVIFAAALGLNDWNVRPQGITFLIAAIFLLVIYKYNQGSRWTWLIVLPIGMLVWANSHGTFVIGIAIIGIWWGQIVWDAFRKRIATKQPFDWRSMLLPSIFLAISALTCFANPRGWGIINYVLTLTGNSVVQNLVTEWAPPSFNSLMGTIFFLGLLGTAIILALSPKRPNFFQVVSFLVFSILGLKTSRGIVWFGVVMAPVLVDHFSAIINQFWESKQNSSSGEGSRTLNFIFAILIVGMGILSLPWFKSILPLPAAKAGLISTETPVQATEFLLKEKPPGRIFNAMSFGSYLIWAAYPEYQVFVDSRIELFSAQVWMDYLNISNANGDWDGLLDKYGVNSLMLSSTEQSLLIKAIDASPSWYMIYLDNYTYIFTRNK